MKIDTMRINPKGGKRDSEVMAHRKNIHTGYEAHRLEGKVKNVGIKNIGHQKKKSGNK